MTTVADKQTMGFQTEAKQMLQLMIHSLYSNKEIFLRELISNASDAADKLRYQALTDNGLYEGDSELKIWIDFNKEDSTITIRDNGIGMTREEAIENLGTIAKSGTKAFKEMLTGDENKDSQLIGQFGVGFYSSFIVADKVIVRTRKAGAPQESAVCWESDGQGEFQVNAVTKQQRGTEIVLHIKDDQMEFVDGFRLRNIVKSYSDHIALPIVMKKALSEDDVKKQEAGEVIIPEEEVVNQANALWTLSKSEIKDEQYKELYKHISHDFEEPMAWAHNKVEGKSEYISLLYIPKRAPFDLWDREHRRGLKLYVKRIFIMDNAEQLLPMYLRFVKGVLDSSDLPLNISRELLQSNSSIDRMKSGCTKRVISMLEKMANNDKEQYAEFWKTFGNVIKEGPAEDRASTDRLQKLFRFSSTHADNESQDVTLEDYVSRMSEGQEKIYYIIGDNFNAVRNSPLLEVFRKKGLEVILMHDRVDEWMMAHMDEFDGKKFECISQGEVDLSKFEDEATQEKQKEDEKQYKEVVDTFKKSLGDRISDVRVTNRLIDSPACVVFPSNGMSGHMQRIMQAAGQGVPETKPILELNPDHKLVQKVKAESDDKRIDQWASLLLNQALLAEGEALADPATFVKELNQLWMELS